MGISTLYKRLSNPDMFDLEQIVEASLRPLPTETGDGTYIKEEKSTGIIKDIPHLPIKDLEGLAVTAKSAITGDDVNDREYIMEQVIEVAADLPSTSHIGKELTNTFLKTLWTDLQHPPITSLGRDALYRKADGSGNNLLWPQIGAAGTPYARSVQPKKMRSASLPDPEQLFDSLLARKEFKEHPAKISSILFYLASIIIHDLFQTNPRDASSSLTSSYLDLQPLYGNNQDEQNAVRTFEDGKLKPDCFSSKRILGFPPGVGVMLIMFNRFHNFVVTQLAEINEGGRFTKPDKSNTTAYATWDNDLFQTARLVTCGLYINIVLKDYVRTILNLNRTDSKWSLDPRAEIKSATEATGNQASAEFNLVYRWHSCISQRDQKWSEDLYKEVFAGKDPHTVNMQQFGCGLGRWEAKLSEDPLERPFANLNRNADGTLPDDDLVKIFEDSVEDVAGAFGASNVPEILRSVEVLGIKQARNWNLATLNEFRSFFSLDPYKTFEEINSDPYIVDQLKHFYDHPDQVELYPGIIVEDAKKAMAPGSGLCTNFTISRAVLSDAVALVRGDRFYTVDYTPNNLTNWAYNEVDYDNSVDQGHVFYKLVLRAFPNHFRGDSIYAHFPMTIPEENRKIFANLGMAGMYSFDKATYSPAPKLINSHAANKAILADQEAFKVTWGKKIEFLVQRDGHPYGRNFMLSGDLPANAASRKMMGKALYREKWREEVQAFYEDITLQLLKTKSYKVAGVSQIDIARDVSNLAHVHFCASIFSLPLKTESNPRGIFTEVELHQIMTLIFTCIFYDVDVSKSFQLEQASRQVSQQLGELVMANVEVVDKAGIVAQIVSHLHRHDALSDYGEHMIKRLLDSGLPAKEVVWTHILPSASSMVANQAQLFVQCLDFYLEKENAAHLAEIQRLSKETSPESDELLLRYFMEGARIRSSVAVPREVAKPTVIDDNGEKLTLKTGQQILCNLVAASHDPVAFPDPEQVRLDRDLSEYIFFGHGPHQCLGLDIFKVALPTMLRIVGKLENLRRTPGPQGQLKKLKVIGGITMYMDAEHSSLSPYPATMKIQWDGDIPKVTPKAEAN
ncbi:Psi-producing oxygenase A [Penicillium maclennaniae]|uniref:Psi-producing oxygenase A n=1 Tax=Penicillium maclennaniae TaxID=1343394 RepID=UPI002540449E|nr:Psi-producing oxygenase A [Penicillium maclennaniae]KAJ5669994.1 Psi-producing oxygenase A [Penicillium maclennaniae]